MYQPLSVGYTIGKNRSLAKHRPIPQANTVIEYNANISSTPKIAVLLLLLA
jgi:hypothetical protein